MRTHKTKKRKHGRKVKNEGPDQTKEARETKLSSNRDQLSIGDVGAQDATGGERGGEEEEEISKLVLRVFKGKVSSAVKAVIKFAGIK